MFFSVCSSWCSVVCLQNYCFFVCGFFVFVQVFSRCYKFALFKPKQKTKNNKCGIHCFRQKTWHLQKINFLKLLKLFKSNWKNSKLTLLSMKKESASPPHTEPTPPMGSGDQAAPPEREDEGPQLHWTELKTSRPNETQQELCFLLWKIINPNFISFHQKMERHWKAATPTRVKGKEIKPNQLHLKKKKWV